MSKTRLLIGLILMVLPLSTALACGGGGEEAASYRIGAVISQTGPYASLGSPQLEGIELMVDEINDAGGIDGHPLKLVVYDDQSDEMQAVLAVRKLIDVDRVHIVLGGVAAGPAMAIAPVVDEAGVPTLLLAGTKILDQPLRHWVFRPAGSELDFIIPILDYWRSLEPPVTKIAVIKDATAFGNGVTAFLEQIAAQYGMEVVVDESISPIPGDVSPQLMAVKNSEAEALYVASATPAGGLAIKQAGEMGITIPIGGPHPLGTPDIVAAVGEAYEIPNLVLVDVELSVWQQLPETDPDKAAYQQFDGLFRARYNKAPSMWHGFGAQHILFIQQALERAKPDPARDRLAEARAAIRDAFETTENFDGLLATYTMSPTDHFGTHLGKDVLIRFEDGEKVIFQTLD